MKRFKKWIMRGKLLRQSRQMLRDWSMTLILLALGKALEITVALEEIRKLEGV